MENKKIINKKFREFIDEDFDINSYIKWNVEMTQCKEDCENCKDITEDDAIGEAKQKRLCKFNQRIHSSDISAGITLTDCNESIGWDFDIDCSSKTKEYQIKKLNKINKIIDILKEFRIALVEGIDLQDEMISSGKKLEAEYNAKEGNN